MDYLAVGVITVAALFHKASCIYDKSVEYSHKTPPVFYHYDYFTDIHYVPDLAEPVVHGRHTSHVFAENTYPPKHHEHYNIKSYNGPIAIPVVLPDGHLADTPEVTLAKIHHLSAVGQAKADKYYSGHAEHGYGGAYGYSGSHNGYGIPVVLPNGHIADTHEVAAAKSAHLLAVAKAKADKYYSGKGEYYGYGGGYSGSHKGYGIPVVLPNGHVADTHEVAAAKSALMTAVALAKAEQSHSQFHNKDNDHADYEDHQYVPDQENYYDLHLYSYDGPHGEYIDIPHHDLSHPLNYHHYKTHHQHKDEPLGSGNFWFFG